MRLITIVIIKLAILLCSCEQEQNKDRGIQIDHLSTCSYEGTSYRFINKLDADIICADFSYFVGHIFLVDSIYYIYYQDFIGFNGIDKGISKFIFFDKRLKMGDSIINNYIVESIRNDTVIEQQILIKNEFENNKYALFSQKFYWPILLDKSFISCFFLGPDENDHQKYVDEYYKQYIVLYFLINKSTHEMFHVATVNEQYRSYCPYYSVNSYYFIRNEVLVKHCLK